MPKLLVTGASGHIGSHVVRASLEEGWDTVGLLRSSSDRRGLRGVDVELREGDLLDADSVRAAMKGVDRVIHVGAVHRNFAPDPDTILRPAVEGTRHVLEAARDAGVERVVYTSTGATVGFSPDPAHPIDETSFLEGAKSPYVRGKIEAERLARRWATEKDRPELVILNPSGVFGPRDYKITPATRGLMGVLQGDPIFFHLCATHVADVGRAHIRAMADGEPGERYLITGDNLAPDEVASLFEELGGKRPATFRPPGFLLRFLVGRGEKKAAREGTDAPASRDALDDLGDGHLVYDASKSRSALGMTYRSAREVFTDTFRWLLHVDALAPKVADRLRRTLGERAGPHPDWA